MTIQLATVHYQCIIYIIYEWFINFIRNSVTVLAFSIDENEEFQVQIALGKNEHL